MFSMIDKRPYARLAGWVLAILSLPALAPSARGQSPGAPNYNPPLAFTHPTTVTNPYLPLSSLNQDVLSGSEDGKPARVVRTRIAETRTFMVSGRPVETIIVIDSAFEGNELDEVAHDYMAQSDNGDVYYFGEDVDNYKDGKIANHEGAWMYGKTAKKLGILFPATPKVGQRFRSEDVPHITREDDEVVSLNETVTVPAGSYRNCVKIKETPSDGGHEYKVYCAGVGVVQEIPEEGRLDLQSHR
jgi:hypothetical protein